MLVPFTGWKQSGESCGVISNGVQLVDWKGDELGLRGMTRSLGQARRAFVANDALFTVADQEVAAYDIADRDAPVQLSGAPLALHVSMTLLAGDHLARLRQDWYSQDVRVEIVPRSAADAFVATTSFNLTDYLRRAHGLEECGYWYPANEPLFAAGGALWALINDYGEWRSHDGDSKSRALLVGFSPETGEAVGSLELLFRAGYWGWGNTSRVVRGNTVYLMQEGYDQDTTRRSLARAGIVSSRATRGWSRTRPTSCSTSRRVSTFLTHSSRSPHVSERIH